MRYPRKNTINLSIFAVVMSLVATSGNSAEPDTGACERSDKNQLESIIRFVTSQEDVRFIKCSKEQAVRNEIQTLDDQYQGQNPDAVFRQTFSEIDRTVQAIGTYVTDEIPLNIGSQATGIMGGNLSSAERAIPTAKGYQTIGR